MNAEVVSFHDEEAAAQHDDLRAAIVDDLRARYEWGPVPCAVCSGSDDSEPAFTKWGLEMLWCRTCDHLYVSPRLPEESVSYLYGTTYWNDYSRAIGSPSIEERADWDYRNAFYKLERDVLPWRSGGVLLDVGASNGGMVRAARESGFAAEGIEPAADICALARRVHGVDLFCGDVRDDCFPASSFDVVTMHDVIEHVFEPVGVLAAVRRVLLTGGLIILETPTTSSANYSHRGPAWPSVSPLEHVNLFNEANMAELLDRTGFVVRDIYSPNEDNMLAVAEAA